MIVDDLILISVDDHVVVPPGFLEPHLPAKYRDAAPKVEHNADGTDVWLYDGHRIPNVGLNAVVGRRIVGDDAAPGVTPYTGCDSARSSTFRSLSEAECDRT